MTLLSLLCCSESGPVIRPALPLPELRFLQCNAFQILSAKCFEKDKNRAVIAPGSWVMWSFLILKGSLVSKVSFVQWLSRVRLFSFPWTAACQASLSFTILWSLLELMSIESVMTSNLLILCRPLLLLQSFPASGSFPMSRLFASGGQRIGASASVLPMSIQG